MWARWLLKENKQLPTTTVWFIFNYSNEETGSKFTGRKPVVRRLLQAGIALVMPALAFAQTPPDAGALQRETERDLRDRLPAAVPAAPPPPMKQADKGATVTVKEFHIEGATLVPATELSALLADLVGQPLTLAELEHAAQRLAVHYRAKGWLVRVYLPAQEILDGKVRIVVVEGKLSGIKVENNAARADAGFAARVATGGLIAGKPLAAGNLERGLLLANDLPGIRTTGILEPGDAAGETRLRLKVEDGPFVAGDAALANQGARATCLAQLAAGLVVNPGGGNQWALRAIASQNLSMLRANYALPLGANGLRANLYISDLRYKLGGDFAALDASGNAQTWGAALAWPRLRSATDNFNLGAALEARRYADDGLGAALRRKTTDALTVSATGDKIDGLGGGGLTQYGVSLVSGKLDLGGVPTDLAADQAGPLANGSYTKLAANASRLQRLPADFSFYAALAAQFAGKNLDSSEKFALGGPNGVRAYPVNEASGDEGWLLNLELRKELGNGWNALALLDAGEVRQHCNEWTGWANSGTHNRYGLAGGGFGLGWNRPGNIALQMTLATPLGGNAGQTITGRNQDGSARATRGWLRVTKYF